MVKCGCGQVTGGVRVLIIITSSRGSNWGGSGVNYNNK